MPQNGTYQRFGESAGYEIGRRDDVVLLVRRGTRAPGLVAWIVGGLCAITGVHAILWPALALHGSVQSTNGWMTGGIFAIVSTLLFFVARAGYRRYQLRKHASVDTLPGLQADLTTGLLRDGARVLAKLPDVRIDTPRNLGDSTQGSMRWVRLSWQGRNVRVYSANSASAESMASLLGELGVGRLS